ncbi:MAG TPA: nitronate monooxygenase [Terriglobales bacterium]|nr:nitronate monooxygenase [Terriglobales bacterium]
MKRAASWAGCELPILQAPMAGSQGGALAAAVSAAGGLGALPAAMLNPAGLRRELEVLRASRRPYNVNFFCHTPPTLDQDREQAWRDCLAPYYAEYGVSPPAVTGATRRPFDGEFAEVLREFRPPVVSFHFGLPAAELVSRVREWGAIVISTATTVAEAVWLEQQGADAVIAQGTDAGGHRGHFLRADLDGQCGTLSLVAQVIAAIRIPVIAAGGIADARGVKAALALGAAAVQVGTAYLLCPEATTSAVHRAALTSADSAATAITNLFSGRPARGIVNRLMRELGPMNPAAPEFPLASAALAPLRAQAEERGDGAFSPLWCGQNPSGCAIVPAGQLTRRLSGLD